MSADFNVKPLGTGSQAAYVKIDRPSEDLSSAELPPRQRVTATERGDSSALGDSLPDDRMTHQVVIDRAAKEIVYRVVDNRTSQVISQFPDEARLRARAYLRSLDEEQASRKAQRADVKV